MTDIPREVQVGPYCCRVDATKEAIEAKRAEYSDDEHTMGRFEIWRELITIDPEQGPGALRDTVLHEVLHVVVYVASLDTSPRKLSDEEIVSRTTPLLLDTLRRNPDLVAFLMEGT